MFNFWDWEQNVEFTGKLVSCIKDVGVFKKPVFVFKQGKKEVHIWGTAQLSKYFYNINFGTLVRIKYLGKFKTDQSRYPVSHFDIKIIKK